MSHWMAAKIQYEIYLAWKFNKDAQEKLFYGQTMATKDISKIGEWVELAI